MKSESRVGLQELIEFFFRSSDWSVFITPEKYCFFMDNSSFPSCLT